MAWSSSASASNRFSRLFSFSGSYSFGAVLALEAFGFTRPWPPATVNYTPRSFSSKSER